MHKIMASLKPHICLLGLILVSTTWAAKFPSNVEKCTAGDSDCLKRVSQDVLISSKDGHKGLGLPSLDPLRVDTINIQEGSGGPVNINLVLKNVTLSGLSKLDVYLMNGFDKKIETPKAMKARLLNGNLMTLEGDYTMSGKILLLPIQGAGRCKMDFHGWDSDWKINPKAVEKNGKQYMTVDNSNSVLKFKVTALTMDYENLFNGDKQLSATLNTFLNENWKDILEELRPSLSETISQIIVSVVSGTFSRIPYNEIFKDE